MDKGQFLIFAGMAFVVGFIMGMLARGSDKRKDYWSDNGEEE